ALDCNLSGRGVAANFQKAHPQNSCFARDRRVLLEESSASRIGQQRRTHTSLPVGSLNTETLGEQWTHFIRLGRSDLVFNATDFLSCSQRSPQTGAAAGAQFSFGLRP